MWTKSENGEQIKPAAVEVSGEYAILRKDFKYIQDDDLNGHYEYMEWQLSRAEYEIYKAFEEQMQEHEDALIELAGIIAEVTG